jgi:kynurenine formamidase
VNFARHSEMVMGTVHTGTHIDALSHVTCGEDHSWFGAGCSERDLGDFGPLRDDATDIPPIITRGVLLDLAGFREVAALPAHEPVGLEELQEVVRTQGVWLAEQGVVAVGGDTESLEVLPSTVSGNPHPVHIALLVDRGTFILEMVNCEELARDRVYEFCFMCLPVSIRGATGSMTRPVAVV